MLRELTEAEGAFGKMGALVSGLARDSIQVTWQEVNKFTKLLIR